jgi:hypothetical protein
MKTRLEAEIKRLRTLAERCEIKSDDAKTADTSNRYEEVIELINAAIEPLEEAVALFT